MGLHICQISVGESDERGEWVCVVGDGPLPEHLSGLEITDYTTSQENVHI